MFCRAALESYLPRIQKVVSWELRGWCMQPGSIAVYSSAKTLTFRIAARILLGLRLEEKQFKDLAKTFEQLVENLFSLPLNVPFSGLRKVLPPAPLLPGAGLGCGCTDPILKPDKGHPNEPGALLTPLLGASSTCLHRPWYSMELPCALLEPFPQLCLPSACCCATAFPLGSSPPVAEICVWAESSGHRGTSLCALGSLRAGHPFLVPGAVLEGNMAVGQPALPLTAPIHSLLPCPFLPPVPFQSALPPLALGSLPFWAHSPNCLPFPSRPCPTSFPL